MKSVRSVFCGVALCLFLFTRAEAQQVAEPVTTADSSVVSRLPAAQPIQGAKSETGALMWSLLGTAVPVAMTIPALSSSESDAGAGASITFLGALLVGPSLGHFYAGRPGRAFAGIGVRTLAMVGLAAAVAATWDSQDSGGEAMGAVSLVIGGAAIVYDIVEAPHSARVHNEKLRQKQVSVGLMRPSGSPGLGVGAEVRF